ncbi:hypothetical protein ACFO9Q_04570 [Paenibacillus sp. GCM10023252]|uniref:hypothetical protein n=1 Tax=Paenibacillus sp. GCM10023252 TaxID=3252649 RepID=UPI0036179C4C
MHGPQGEGTHAHATAPMQAVDSVRAHAQVQGLGCERPMHCAHDGLICERLVHSCARARQ